VFRKSALENGHSHIPHQKVVTEFKNQRNQFKNQENHLIWFGLGFRELKPIELDGSTKFE
jgi:hypothetical protein